MEIIGWMRRRLLGVPERPAGRQFSAVRPIDDHFREMLGAGSTIARLDALRIPGVKKGRDLLCSIATLPLVERGPGNAVVRAPLLEQIDPNVPNVVTLAMTLEDLLFDSVSWWRVTARGFDGYPTSARRLEPGSVSLDPPRGARQATLPSGVNPEGKVVYVDGVATAAADVIRFDSPNPPLAQVAAATFRQAKRYLDAAAMYAANPQPTEHFTAADGDDEREDEEVREHLSKWAAARRAGATAYIPRWLKYEPGSTPTAADQKLVELKAQAALETALHLGLDPEVLGVSTTSRTYANAQDWRRDRINDVLAPYMLAITQRLSMMDLCRRGYVRTFDLDDYMRADPATRVAYYQGLIAMGAIDVDYVQAEEGLPVVGAVTPPSTGTPSATPGPTGVPADELSARRNRVASFATAATARSFEFRASTFNVDTTTRTIRGLALPYGEIASKYGLKFRFAAGSIEWNNDTLSRIKLLRDHDYGQAHGVATAITSTDAGLDTAFRVGAGPERDAVLADAQDGIVDGLSVGVEFDEAVDTVPDPDNEGVLLVRRATLREVSLTAMPAFDSARVTTVAARRDGGPMHTCTTCGLEMKPGVAHVCAGAPAGPVTLTAEQFAQLVNRPAAPADPGPTPVDPAGPDGRPAGGPAFVSEALPYAFQAARPGQAAHFRASDHDFSTDVVAMLKARDERGDATDAGRRVMGFISAQFDVDSTDANETHPTMQRPDMYVDQRDYRYPLWAAVNKGAPPNGIQPFTFPRFNAASGLVGDHTEGTEPTGGTLTTTGQTVTPTAISGKAYLTREVWDMGGNPAVSTLVWNQMVRGYREGLESATATFLNTLTAATDITLTAGAVDDALADAWEAAVAALQFTRGYDFEFFAVEQALYLRFAAAEDSTGRPLFPMIGPMNTNGQARTRFRTLDLAGVEGIPSWALASTPGSPNNSWLFDPTTVHGWATQPQRLEFEGAADDNTSVAPIAKIGIGIWGYKAFANSDIGGVRQVIYDTTA